MKSLSLGLRTSLLLTAVLTVVSCEQPPVTAPRPTLASKSVSTPTASGATFAYVVNTGSNTVSVIATATNTVEATFAVGSYPLGVGITPDGGFAYVTNYLSNTVSVIATATNTIVATVAVGSGPHGVDFTPDGVFAYVTNTGSNTVSVIATATNAVVATVGVGSFPEAVAITPDGVFAYVTNYGAATVSVIATTTNTVVATISVGAIPDDVAITPDGAFAYVTNSGTNTVSVIATASNTVAATIAVAYYPFGVAVSPDGAFAYVTNNVSNMVSVIATATNTVVATVVVGSYPIRVAISPDGGFAYVTNYFSNTVSVIATASNTVVATVPVGINAYGVAITPEALTTTSLHSTPDPSAFGESVTLTATVTKTSDASSVTTGTVDFIEGGTCTSPTTILASGSGLDGSGQAAFATSTLGVGTHTVIACYSGTTAFKQSDGSDTQTVNAATTATVVTATPSTQQYSDKVTLSATVTPLTINSSPVTGAVQFQIDGVNAGGPATLSETGTATLADYALTQPSGSHAITALFSSTNADFSGSESDGVSLTVTTENAVIASDGVDPFFKGGASGNGSLSLGFTVMETIPDLDTDTGAPGDISFAGLSVTLIPEKKGASSVGLTCTSSVAGTGYGGVNSFTCIGSDIPIGHYQVIASVAGIYFTGSYSGEVKPGK